VDIKSVLEILEEEGCSDLKLILAEEQFK